MGGTMISTSFFWWEMGFLIVSIIWVYEWCLVSLQNFTWELRSFSSECLSINNKYFRNRAVVSSICLLISDHTTADGLIPRAFWDRRWVAFSKGGYRCDMVLTFSYGVFPNEMADGWGGSCSQPFWFFEVWCSVVAFLGHYTLVISALLLLNWSKKDMNSKVWLVQLMLPLFVSFLKFWMLVRKDSSSFNNHELILFSVCRQWGFLVPGVEVFFKQLPVLFYNPHMTVKDQINLPCTLRQVGKQLKDLKREAGIGLFYETVF
jgi:hypothetical protein